VPILPPSLDDRSYDDLVQEMLANIPAHTPEWTNPQPGDPGRTLIELFAWLADTILYRANLIPERQRLAFLKLLGQAMQPAAAAKGLVSLTLDPSLTTPISLASAAKVQGPPVFETLSEISVLPVTGQVYVKVPLTPDQQNSSQQLLKGLQKLYGVTTPLVGYTTTPLFANGMADPVGIDLANGTADQSLWIALLAAKPEFVGLIKPAIGGTSAGQQILNVGFAPAIAVPGLFSDIGPQAAVQATWQMTASKDTPPPGQPIAYNTLKVIEDTTQGLTQPGVVRLMVPDATQIGAPPNDVRSDIQAGVGAKPPRIDDPATSGRLIAWVRLSVTSGLSVSWAGVNAVEIDQRTTFNSVVIGVSDGSGGQQFAVSQNQIDPSTFQLEVDMPGLGYQLWKQVDDLSVLQGPAPAYELDPEAGMVTFGNQMQGMIVPLGRRIRVRQMRAGGGAAGNLQPQTLTTIQGADLTGNPLAQTITVLQPIATTGGADSETLDNAEQRIPALLRHQDRAVTASDYQTLAENVPGANVARVEVLPLFKPQTRSPNIPGVVSVMIIPGKDGVLAPCPRADRPLLETVYQYLDPRRPVAAEMYVIASEYVGLSVTIAVEVRSGYGLLQVSQAVETALRSYLWPIPPGGNDQTGWPLGRNVRSLELDVIVSQVPGISEVDGINLYQLQSTGSFQQLAVDQNGNSELTLSSWQLPEVLQVVVQAGPDGTTVVVPPLTPTDTGGGAGSGGGTTVAVPIVPKVC
jgi:hypothetical protein